MNSPYFHVLPEFQCFRPEVFVWFTYVAKDEMTAGNPLWRINIFTHRNICDKKRNSLSLYWNLRINLRIDLKLSQTLLISLFMLRLCFVKLEYIISKKLIPCWLAPLANMPPILGNKEKRKLDPENSSSCNFQAGLW